MKKITTYIIIPLLLILSCSYNKKDDSLNEGSFIIWAHSDIQPRSETEKIQYENAVADIRENFNKIDMAIFAGDIVQHSNFEEIFKWFLNTRREAPVNEWHEIAGNHDWRAIGLYRQYINNRLYYSVTRGNLLILMISNERPGKQTYISDETFQWWENLVINNQDKIIITVTHGALEGSGIAESHLERLVIKDSERFSNVLKKYKVDIWISGHSHFPGWFPKMCLTNKNFGGTTFVDLGAIRKDFLTASESRILYLQPGSSSALMKTRNHYDRKFSSDNFLIPLSHPLRF